MKTIAGEGDLVGGELAEQVYEDCSARAITCGEEIFKFVSSIDRLNTSTKMSSNIQNSGKLLPNRGLLVFFRDGQISAKILEGKRVMNMSETSFIRTNPSGFATAMFGLRW